MACHFRPTQSSSMYMKMSSFILSLVVPGPSSPRLAIDVYLQPLVEELKDLWDVRVDAYDASYKNHIPIACSIDVDHK